MTMHPANLTPRQQGFTLIELMVGVVLGMLTIVAIAQVLVMSEGRKRTITGGADAQISGALGLYAIQREVQMAGYGVSANPAALGCMVKYKVDTNPISNFTLVPVVIDSGTNGSNTITVLKSTKNSFSVPIKITENHASDGSYFLVQSSVGVAENDLLIAVPPAPSATAWCSVVQVQEGATNLLTTIKIPHAEATDADWNPPASANLFPTDGYPAAGSYLLNVGSLSLRRFSVDTVTQALQVSDLSRAGGVWSTPQDAQSQVVMLRAMYGKDTNADKVVDRYDNDTPSTTAEWQQVLSIRTIVVARSTQFEKDNEGMGNATNNTLEWDLGTTGVTVVGATTCHTDHQCLPISLTHLGTDWNKYRYKVYDTVIPLRNMLWNS
jgi:type IV pilus assembly protein PilW